MKLNAWLGGTLVVLDPVAWPLAAPAVFNKVRRWIRVRVMLTPREWNFASW